MVNHDIKIMINFMMIILLNYTRNIKVIKYFIINNKLASIEQHFKL